MGYLNLEDDLMACTYRGNSDKLDIRHKRYVVMTSDKKQIFCSLARHFTFKDVDKVDDTPVKTYMTAKKAISSFVQSWWNAEKKDFELAENI